MRARGALPSPWRREPGITSLCTTHACDTNWTSRYRGVGDAVGLLELTAVFVFGFAAGYGTREIISRRRRRAAQSTFIYPE